MAKSISQGSVFGYLLLNLLAAQLVVFGQLTPGFYYTTCPEVEDIVFVGMQQAVQKEARMAASILRLFFHDCFVQGCDASILLDDTAMFQSEKTAAPNNNSVRGFDVIDSIKAQVEFACPGIVSCADILAIASRDGVVLSQGPRWDVLLGRRDSRTASLSLANTNIPAPNSTLSALISKFSAQGLSILDLVTLSGAHTIGQSRCVSFRQRLYNKANSGQQDPTIAPLYAQQLQSICPPSGGDNNLFPLDIFTPTLFNNQYYTNLEINEGLLNSDEVLYTTTGSSTLSMAQNFASSQADFFASFTASMVKMGNIGTLTGSNGEIRKTCRAINS